MSEPQHLNSPFSFNAKGESVTVEEESPACILAGVYNIVVCPEGFREDEPEFGIPPLEFSTVPVHVRALQEAVKRWEPEATLTVTEKAVEASRQQERVLNIEIQP